ADSTNLGNNYTISVGALAIHSNQLVTTAPGLSLAAYSGAVASDVSVQADVVVASTGFSHAGLIARYAGTGDSNMYLGTIVGSNGSFTAQIWRNVAGAWTQLTSKAVATGTGTLRLVVLGDSLQLFLNGNLVGSTVDSALQGPGLVGVRG